MSQTAIVPITPKRFIMVYATTDLNVDFDQTIKHYMTAYDRWHTGLSDKFPVTNNSKPAALLRIVIQAVQDLIHRDVCGGRADAYLAVKAHLDHLKDCEDYVLLVDQVAAMAERIYLSLPDEVCYVSYVAYPHGCLYVYAGDGTLEHTHYHWPRPTGEPHAQST